MTIRWSISVHVGLIPVACDCCRSFRVFLLQILLGMHSGVLHPKLFPSLTIMPMMITQLHLNEEIRMYGTQKGISWAPAFNLSATLCGLHSFDSETVLHIRNTVWRVNLSRCFRFPFFLTALFLRPHWTISENLCSKICDERNIDER